MIYGRFDEKMSERQGSLVKFRGPGDRNFRTMLQTVKNTKKATGTTKTTMKKKKQHKQQTTKTLTNNEKNNKSFFLKCID